MQITKSISGWIFKRSPQELLGISTGLILATVMLLSLSLVKSAPKAVELYIVLAVLALALFITRSIEPWEWGIEIYHILIFGVSLEFGILIPLALNLFTFMLVPVHQMIEHPYKHYLTKSLPGPIIQSIILSITTIAFGLLGRYAYQSVLNNMALYYISTLLIADYMIGNILRKAFTPLEPFRLLIYSTIGIAFNYYLITNFGASFISFLHALK